MLNKETCEATDLNPIFAVQLQENWKDVLIEENQLSSLQTNFFWQDNKWILFSSCVYANEAETISIQQVPFERKCCFCLKKK